MNADTPQVSRTSTAARRLVGAVATIVLSLAITAAPASAKTVYDYVYSGSAFNGADTFEPFDNSIAGLAYDAHREQILVARGVISKFTKNGAATPFSGLASPSTLIGGGGAIAVDQSGGPTDGNFVAAANVSGGNHRKFTVDGKEWTENATEFRENTCGVAIDPQGRIWLAHRFGFILYEPDGTVIPANNFNDYFPIYTPRLQAGVGGTSGRSCRPAIDSAGYIYSQKGTSNASDPYVKVDPEGGFAESVDDITGKEEIYQLNTADSQAVDVDRSTDDVFAVEGNGFTQYDSEGRRLGGKWGGPEGEYEGITSSTGIAVDPVSHDVWVANHREYPGGIRRVERFERINPQTIPDTTVAPVTQDSASGTVATLHGIVNPDGVETTDCYFEYGQSPDLGTAVDCAEGDNFTGSSNVPVSAEISTERAKRYYYRLSAKNSNERVALSNETRFIAQGRPKVDFVHVDRVTTDGARMSADIDPNGGNTTYHFDWGLEGNGFETSGAESDPPFGFKPPEFGAESEYVAGFHPQSFLATGLESGKSYEYRIVATNEAGTTVGPTETFTTYVPDEGTDVCPNSHVRQQTSASLLPECRAYELVSDSYTGGFDVVSDIVPGQTPFVARPRAKDRLLYSVHFGVIPGIAGSPTNLGRDPYVAIRDPESGWITEYVGLPADGMPDGGKFGSPLLASDPFLGEFAFGGEDICDPCFKDGSGESTNVPVRRPDGSLIRGMAGPLNPHADPDGLVEKPFSDDGSHFVFAASQRFHSDGNEGEVSIYDRDFDSGATQVVSTMPNGTTLTGDVAQLDISTDGSRVLVGKLVGNDGAGNPLYDLYMHVGNNPGSVEVADTSSGVHYNGMSDDGSRVFFSTPDQLDDDSDTSIDAFSAEIENLAASVERVSTGIGGTGNTDLCEPVGEPDTWNAASGDGKCNAVAFAGGGGVAAGDGSFYFMSPEQLDGGANGEPGEVNLYLVPPGGSPEFVETIDSSAVKPPPAPAIHPLVSTSFITGLSTPEGIAVDQSNGDIYVAERGSGGRIARFDSTGAAKDFEVPGGSNRIANSGIGGQGEAQIAFDSAPGSPLNGSFYVRNGAGTVAVYSTNGENIGSLTGFNEACGVAVNQATGTLYVGDYSYKGVRRFEPTSGTTPVSKANYTETTVKTLGMNPCAVGADTSGKVYATKYSTGPIVAFDDGEFAPVPPEVVGETITESSRAVSTDPETDEVYISEANQIGQYDSSGALRQKFGSGNIGNNARGVAIHGETGTVYVQFGTSIVKFGLEEVPYEPIDDQAVLNAVDDAASRSFGDVQVTPDGRYVAFSSRVPLTGYPTNGNEEIYRYDTQTGETDCASCPPSGIAAQAGASLSKYGLNLSDDGRVFFTTLDELALRDANEKLDVYEWSNGASGLLTTGQGEEDSGLVTASSDGEDIFFYTRDKLHAHDENGRVIKIYDARAGGGFPVDPPRLACAASDECHGAGTQQPLPPNINSHHGVVRGSASASNGRCRNLARRAKRNSNRSKQLRRKASKSSHGKGTAALRRRAKQSAKKARQLSRKAKACRRSGGGNG